MELGLPGTGAEQPGVRVGVGVRIRVRPRVAWHGGESSQVLAPSCCS